MSNQGLSIAEAARSLGVSTRTVRRLIKAGKMKAELVRGQFGDEYRISELPQGLHGRESAGAPPARGSVNTVVQSGVQAPPQPMDIIRELQDKNLALAAQLGAATERLRNLESQIKLLSAPKRPWWKQLFGWFR